MRKNFIFLSSFFVLVACTLFMMSLAHSASLKEQMAARLPAIKVLKDKGVIGENNQGYLEYRSGSKPQEELVRAENGDRATVYAAIAKQQGAPPALVGQRRAKMIADNGQAGHWYQKPDGSWYRK